MHRSTAFRGHWPEYLIEAWALGTFMVSAGVFTMLIEHPDFPVHAAIPSAAVRRVLIGLAMGATAIALIYSPWGRRSGAHMNPAVTLAFLRLGKLRPADAAGYIAAQFAGGLAGVLVLLAVLGERFSAEPVAFVATRPGALGAGAAFAAEALISALLMATVLALSSRVRLARFTGLAAGTLVALYIALEAPVSGMSMNPARSFASAAPGGLWADLWVYFAAPPLGMLAAAQLAASRAGGCAKLHHARDQRCIHCGYVPSTRATPAGEASVPATPQPTSTT